MGFVLRQLDVERGATRPALHRDLPLVVAHDAAHDGQPEAGAPLLSVRGEGLEEARAMVSLVIALESFPYVLLALIIANGFSPVISDFSNCSSLVPKVHK